MIEIPIASWLVWALGIASITSAFLNGAPFLPGLNQLQPSQTAKRWTGYIGLTAAFWLWIVANPKESVEAAGVAWILLCLVTLIPNALIHFYQPDGPNMIQPPLNRKERDFLLNALAERLEAEMALRIQKKHLQALLDERDRRTRKKGEKEK